MQAVFSDKFFFKDVIQLLIEQWQKDEQGVVLYFLLEWEKEFFDFFFVLVQESLKEGFVVKFVFFFLEGFCIGLVNGSYVVLFIEEDFQVFFVDFLWLWIKIFLYGEGQILYISIK